MEDSGKLISLPFIAKDKVRDAIKNIVSSKSQNLDILNHAITRMEERDISIRQILNVLKNGDQVGDITWCSDRERGWRCKLSRVTAGNKVTVVAKLVKRDNVHCLVVTTWEG